MRSLLIGVMCVLLASAGEPVGDGPVYVAVGDSLAVGMGASPSGDGGFVSVLAAQNPVCEDETCPALEVANFGSPGATSDTVAATQLGPAVELISQRRRDGSNGNGVALVTVTVGGNDLFGSVFAACRRGPTDGCRAAASEAFTAYLQNLDAILGELRAAAGPDTPIVTMTLYNPFPACLLTDLAPAAETVLEGGMAGLGGFNDIIRVVAGAHGVEVVETARLFPNADYVGGVDCIHPNASGHAKLAAAFAAVADGTQSAG